jgi:ketosteroid isomerase-like protein
MVSCVAGTHPALDEFGEINRGLDEAYNRNDAAGVAAFFTEDALLVAPNGMFSGRQNIMRTRSSGRLYRL